MSSQIFRTRDADVVVIGAGLVGAATAAQLAGNGLRVAVVDAQATAGGATRHALGLATPDPNPAHTANTARGVRALQSLAASVNLTPRQVSVLHLTRDENGAAALRALAANPGAGEGNEWSWETDPTMVPDGYAGGLRSHNSILIDPASVVVRLLQQPGILVRPHTEIAALEASPNGVVAVGSDVTVQAGAIVLATNAYTGLLSPYLADAARIVRGVVWRSWPQSRPRLSMPVSIDQARVVAAQTLDMRVCVAAWGWHESTGGDQVAAARAYLDAHLPDLLNETEAWATTTTTVTSDGAPMIGALPALTGAPGRPGRIYYALGAGPYGLAWAPLMAEQVARLVLGSANAPPANAPPADAVPADAVPPSAA
jgi:glycine/D-amino acid oxidase-like deaminating enzyme